MIKVYGFPKTRSLRVTWTLEEIGIDYECMNVELSKGEARQPAFLRLNPMAKVPVLVDGNFVLSESGAICTYLADKHPASKLAPEPRTETRALYDQMCLFALTELEQPLWTMAKHRFALPEKLRVPEVFAAAKWEFARAVAALGAWLGERDFVLGGQFTVADVLVGHVLSWARNNEMPIAATSVNAYADRVLARPAMARARAKEQRFSN
jgi:glutathione S-transferase